MNNMGKRRQIFIDTCEKHKFEDSAFNWGLWKTFWKQGRSAEEITSKFIYWKERMMSKKKLKKILH